MSGDDRGTANTTLRLTRPAKLLAGRMVIWLPSARLGREDFQRFTNTQQFEVGRIGARKERPAEIDTKEMSRGTNLTLGDLVRVASLW